MMKIYLTDSQHIIDFSDYWGDEPVKFMMKFRKIFLSVTDLILPILEDSQPDLNQLTWQSTSHDFAIFKQLLQEWVTVEMRLGTLTQLHHHDKAAELLKQARLKRQTYLMQPQATPALWGDWVFLQTLHGLLDAELSAIAIPFYSPVLQQTWKTLLPAQAFQITKQVSGF